jgi:oligoendopeptidase F
MALQGLPVKRRSFLPEGLVLDSWAIIEPFFINLLNRNIDSVSALEHWLADRSELAAALEEEQAWRYIRMNCDTENKKLAMDFEFFVSDIVPGTDRYFHSLDVKIEESGWLEKLDHHTYYVFIRALKRRLEIFREENVELLARLQVIEQEYGRIMGSLMVNYHGKELTLQQASNILLDPDRSTREEIFRKINEKRISKVDVLHDLFSELAGKRMQVANNAGFSNYRDYKFSELGRFDYSVDDCFQFHASVCEHVKPMVEAIHRKRREELGYSQLKPWDLEVDTSGIMPFVPFTDACDLVDKTARCFDEIRAGYGSYLKIMHEHGFMDLESRKGKAPGGFNYPLYESNVPFIFMNAVGNQRDVETMVHEGGHALHSFLSADLPLVDFKSLPSEVAELASMSMELISMEHWQAFFPGRKEWLRARRTQLESVITILPWIMCIDRFQHWIYTHPGHTMKERDQAWVTISREQLSSEVDYSGVEESYTFAWQRQLHIFEMPFYYIEYAISQLGAIAIWRNYHKNPDQALTMYENALRVGYGKPIPDIYRLAGIEFNFSPAYIKGLMEFVWEELEKIYQETL